MRNWATPLSPRAGKPVKTGRRRILIVLRVVILCVTLLSLRGRFSRGPFRAEEKKTWTFAAMRQGARFASLVRRVSFHARGSIMAFFRAAWIIVREALSDFVGSDAMSHAAGVSFYTALGLAPTVLLFLSIMGLLGGVAEQSLVNEINQLVGEQAAEGVELVITNSDRRDQQKTAGVFSTVVSIGTFLFSASGVFAQLQFALNKIWKVMPRPDAGFLDTIRQRLISIGMVLGMLVLMLASLVMSAAISVVVPQFSGFWRLGNIFLSIAVFTLCFGLIFKFLPDVRITWRDVAAGAFMTAVLFSLGKWAIGLYLGHSAIGSSYGVAGSLIVLLVWVYYSAIIILFGAEMTEVYARRFGSGIRPNKHAVRVEPPSPVETRPSTS